jgi:hypothetical protein
LAGKPHNGKPKKAILKKGGTYGWKYETHRIVFRITTAAKPARSAGIGAD